MSTERELLDRCLPFLKQQARRVGLTMLTNGETEPSEEARELVALIREIEAGRRENVG